MEPLRIFIRTSCSSSLERLVYMLVEVDSRVETLSCFVLSSCTVVIVLAWHE